MQAELAVKLSKLQKEKDFLQQTSESLLRNQDDFRTQLLAEQTKSQAKDAQITDLTEQVGTLVRCTPFTISFSYNRHECSLCSHCVAWSVITVWMHACIEV